MYSTILASVGSIERRTICVCQNEKNYPEFVPDYVYAVVPDEAAAGMEVYNVCVSCQLANSDFDVQAMSQALSHALWDTDEENDSDYFIKQEYHREIWYESAGRG